LTTSQESGCTVFFKCLFFYEYSSLWTYSSPFKCNNKRDLYPIDHFIAHYTAIWKDISPISKFRKGVSSFSNKQRDLSLIISLLDSAATWFFFGNRRFLKIIGLFCTRDLSKRWYSAKETYHFKEPTNRSHPKNRPARFCSDLIYIFWNGTTSFYMNNPKELKLVWGKTKNPNPVDHLQVTTRV